SEDRLGGHGTDERGAVLVGRDAVHGIEEVVRHEQPFVDGRPGQSFALYPGRAHRLVMVAGAGRDDRRGRGGQSDANPILHGPHSFHRYWGIMIVSHTSKVVAPVPLARKEMGTLTTSAFTL